MVMVYMQGWAVSLDNPPGVKLVAFADDVALLATARTGGELANVINLALDRVSAWMRLSGLQIAPNKSEAIMLTRKWCFEEPRISIDGHEIVFKPSVRYLGVELDRRLTFTRHVKKVVSSATSVATAIGRLMPNIGGPGTAENSFWLPWFIAGCFTRHLFGLRRAPGR